MLCICTVINSHPLPLRHHNLLGACRLLEVYPEALRGVQDGVEYVIISVAHKEVRLAKHLHTNKKSVRDRRHNHLQTRAECGGLEFILVAAEIFLLHQNCLVWSESNFNQYFST